MRVEHQKAAIEQEGTSQQDEEKEKGIGKRPVSKMIIDTVQHALMITSFVFVMMLIIEYVNVQTKGDWQYSVKRSRWGQYLLAGLLGATPGCLGAFTVVALYSHNVYDMSQ